MKKVNNIVSLAVSLLALSTAAEATSIFARQYNVSCNTCHVGGTPPMMNATGMAFLRNGMRFSKSDETTLRAALDGKVAPVGVFLGAGYKTAEMTAQVINPKTKKPMQMQQSNEVTNPTANLLVAGSLSENVSMFAGGKFAYAEDSVTGDRALELLGSKVYVQVNAEDTKHVVRGGLISPYTQFANVTKASENAGLDDAPNFFSSPLSMANRKNIYGMDYTYLTDDGIMFLAAGGMIDKGHDETDIILGVNYFSGENFRISGIMNYITETESDTDKLLYQPSDATLGERTTFMVPVEYKFEYAYFNTAAVYVTNSKDKLNNKVDDYYGSESSLTIPVYETIKLRAVGTFDSNNATGYSFGYTQLFLDHIMIGANAAIFKTDTADFSSYTASINFIY